MLAHGSRDIQMDKWELQNYKKIYKPSRERDREYNLKFYVKYWFSNYKYK